MSNRDNDTRIVGPRSEPTDVHNLETKILSDRVGTPVGKVQMPPGGVRLKQGAQPGSDATQASGIARGGAATQIVPPEFGNEAASSGFNPVVGWLVVIEGKGRGRFAPVFLGNNSIGREEGQIILAFGDEHISRADHASLIYDHKNRKYYLLRDSGKSLVYLGDAPVLQPTELKDRSIVTIGETRLLFVALCDDKFDWRTGDEPAKA